MPRKFQKPTTETSSYGDLVESHPAYGTISASRISGTTILFASEVKHFGYVKISIGSAARYLNSHEDRVSGGLGKHLCEVELSEAQWAAFISRMNMGDGTPCTLRYHGSAPLVQVPEIEEAVTAENRLHGYADSMGKTLDERGMTATAELRALAEKLNKRDREKMLGCLSILTESLQSSVQFGKHMLKEHAEKLVNDAKIEIHAAVNAKITSLGIDAAARGAALTIAQGDNHEND